MATTDIEYREFLTYIICPALQLLPESMRDTRAKAMMLAIPAQESRLKYRHQIGGPARGFWQFERIGVAGVVKHPKSAGHLERVCQILKYPMHVSTLHTAIEHNDLLACCIARLALYTHPDPLPERDQPHEGWKQYLAVWRPGKPHPESWDGHYLNAWEAVDEIH